MKVQNAGGPRRMAGLSRLKPKRSGTAPRNTTEVRIWTTTR